MKDIMRNGKFRATNVNASINVTHNNQKDVPQEVNKNQEIERESPFHWEV